MLSITVLMEYFWEDLRLQYKDKYKYKTDSQAVLKVMGLFLEFVS